MRTIVATAGVAGVAALLLTGCGSGATAGSPDPSSSSGLDGDITVFAAASLTSTFTELGTEFEAAHPGTTVRLSFAGSSDLATQITSGAPADVFASAATKNMDDVVSAGDAAGDPVGFATNVLEIATPAGNPRGITSLADLANPDLKTVVCAPQVPCGAATAKVEAAAGITIPAVSEESSVTDVLGKVTSGEADAGLVYVTDVTSAGGAVTGVAFPESAGAVNTYPIVALQRTTAPATAAAFLAFVTGTNGQKVLSDAGFGGP